MKRVTIDFNIQGSVTFEKETEYEAVNEFMSIIRAAGVGAPQVTVRTKVEEIVPDPKPPEFEVYLGTINSPLSGPIHVFVSTRQHAEVCVYAHSAEPTFWELDELRTEPSDLGWHGTAAMMLDKYLQRERRD